MNCATFECSFAQECDFSTLRCMVLWPYLALHENVIHPQLYSKSPTVVSYIVCNQPDAQTCNVSTPRKLTVHCLSNQILHMYKCSTSSPSQEQRKCMDVKSCAWRILIQQMHIHLSASVCDRNGLVIVKRLQIVA
jgi:hypothetical protein